MPFKQRAVIITTKKLKEELELIRKKYKITWQELLEQVIEIDKEDS